MIIVSSRHVWLIVSSRSSTQSRFSCTKLARSTIGAEARLRDCADASTPFRTWANLSSSPGLGQGKIRSELTIVSIAEIRWVGWFAP